MARFPWQTKWQSKEEQGFEPVPTSASDEGSNDIEFESYRRHKSGGGRRLAVLAAAGLGIAVAAAGLGFYFGREHGMDSLRKKPQFSKVEECVDSTQDEYEEGLLKPAGDVTNYPMTWNGTFAHMEPSMDNYNWGWREMFPGYTFEGGIVQHPRVSPQTSALAVYHQLHCIQVIQNNFWIAVMDHNPENKTRLPFHMEQCIDYLTQAILCAADTNLEPLDPDLYGAKTSIPRKCRDITSVRDWARRWQTKEDMTYTYSAHRELERTVYIPGFESERFPGGNTCGGMDPCPRQGEETV